MRICYVIRNISIFKQTLNGLNKSTSKKTSIFYRYMSIYWFTYIYKKRTFSMHVQNKIKIKLGVFERLMRLRAVYFELSTIEVIYGIVSRVGGVVSV